MCSLFFWFIQISPSVVLIINKMLFCFIFLGYYKVELLQNVLENKNYNHESNKKNVVLQ